MLKNFLCVVFCILLGYSLHHWWRWSTSLIIATIVCGVIIAWPTLRFTVMLFIVSLFHEDGRKILFAILHFYLLTGKLNETTNRPQRVALTAFACFPKMSV